jgi:hypothetical protein
VTYVIAEPCIDTPDRGCVEEYPVEMIHKDERPAASATFTAANARFLTPGGASTLHRSVVDLEPGPGNRRAGGLASIGRTHGVHVLSRTARPAVSTTVCRPARATALAARTPPTTPRPRSAPP